MVYYVQTDDKYGSVKSSNSIVVCRAYAKALVSKNHKLICFITPKEYGSMYIETVQYDMRIKQVDTYRAKDNKYYEIEKGGALGKQVIPYKRV